jgi:hypothetical protein
LKDFFGDWDGRNAQVLVLNVQCPYKAHFGVEEAVISPLWCSFSKLARTISIS